MNSSSVSADQLHLPEQEEARILKSEAELAQETRRLRQTREQLAAKQRRLETVTEAAGIGVWELSRSDGSLYMNKVARALFWLPQEAPVKINDCMARMNAQDLPRIRDSLDALMERAEPFECEAKISSPSGEARWIQCSVSPLLDPEGRVMSAVGTAIDATAWKRETGEFQSALDLAEAAANAKTDFLARMSHEIRTPMNAILAPTHLLAESSLDGSQRELVTMIQHAGEHLLDVINTILDFSKLEAGKMTLSEVAFDVGTLMADALTPFGIIAGNRGVQLSYRIASGALGQWMGDPARIRQIILNLVSNALKFTPNDGEVEVSVSRWAGEDGIQPGLEFRVRDTGCGLSLQETERIFLPFEQGSFGESQRPGGTGLGLSICRELVDLMGGIIGVDSAPGEGSEFWFCLPMTTVEPESNEPAPAPSPDQTIILRETPPKILVVEDNPSNRKVVSLLLKKLDCQVSVAADGIQALEALALSSFDLVLMDCEMPVMSGYECARKIREQEEGRSRRTPVIALSAHVSEEHRAQCEACGMDGTLSKPISLAELRTAIHKWCVPSPSDPPRGTGVP